jgi:hypothetical protein
MRYMMMFYENEADVAARPAKNRTSFIDQLQQTRRS